MCASYLLPVHLFSNCLKFCGTKFHSVNIMCSRSVFNVACRLERARMTCCPLSPHSLWLHPQNKVAWSQSAASYSTVVSDSEPISDSATTESAVRLTNPTFKPMRRDRLERQSLLREMIHNKGDTAWTDDDWLRVADSLSLTGQEPWQVMCMHTLYMDKNILVARNLMAYLEGQLNAANLIAVTFYIGLLGETSSGLEVQDDEIYKYYQYLLSRTPVLDAASIEVLISALSSTRYYGECLKLLETCRETSNPSSLSLVKLLRAGLRNHDIDVCQIALSELEQLSDPTGITVSVPKVIEECLAVNNQEGLQIVMNFVQRHKLLLKRAELEEVVNIFHRYQPNQWTANYGYIQHRDGRCNVCGHQMKPSEVNCSDFQSIQATFLDQVIVGSNVFFKSSPDEVNSFVKFIEKMGSFDVVIDGLNVLFHNCRKPDFKQLEKAVDYFTSQGKKVLVVGSRMLTGYTNNTRKLVPRPAVYMTSTTKADDAFFLYAALHSGKHTLVVSCDKLRDHKYLLTPSLRPIFHQWILSAQVYDWFISRSGQFVIGKRHLYMTGPAKDDGGWHIPENDISAANPFGKFSVLCMRNKASLTGSHETDTNSRSFRQTVTSGSDRDQEIRQTVTAGPNSLSQPKHTHNKQYQKNFTRPRRDKTDIVGGSRETGIQSNNTKFKGENEWFDN